jgi:peptidoglycan DL-endopeptidase CwlO
MDRFDRLGVRATRQTSANERARRTLRYVIVVASLFAMAGVNAPTVARADRIANSRAEAKRVLAQIQSDGQRLEVVIERYDGARVRLAETMRRIHDNEVRLAGARRNLRAARHALNVSLISAYKHPMPDPLQAALEARNFGQVLEQFALLDRANRNSADELAAIRTYGAEVDKRQRSLNQERNARRETLGELRALKGQIQASVKAEQQRYRALRSEVRRLIEERRRAEIAASRRAAERARLLQAASEAQPVATNDIGGVAAGAATEASAPSSSVPVIMPAPSSLGASAVNFAVGQLGTPYVWGGSAPGGFDCSGLVAWAFAQAGRSGLPHYTGALWSAGTRVSSQSSLAPGDLVFFHGLGHMGIYIGNDQFVHAPHSGDVVKISGLSSYGGYVGAVRISG